MPTEDKYNGRHTTDLVSMKSDQSKPSATDVEMYNAGAKFGNLMLSDARSSRVKANSRLMGKLNTAHDAHIKQQLSAQVVGDRVHGMTIRGSERTRHANTSSAMGIEMASIFSRSLWAPEESVLLSALLPAKCNMTGFNNSTAFAVEKVYDIVVSLW